MKSVIFNQHEVIATRQGSKSQFRRPLKPQPCECFHKDFPDNPKAEWVCDGDEWHCAVCGNGVVINNRSKNGVSGIKCPYGKVGDRLAVKETFYPVRKRTEKDSGCVYFADNPRWSKWKSPAIMPQWASRMTIEITGIRIERVQDISVSDFNASGYRTWEEFYDWKAENKDSWERNDYVWVTEYKVVK